MNILLCGLQASGKTTLGKHLSTALNCPFIDTDFLIESAYTAQTGKELSCRQIYKQEGESYFRALESQEMTRLQPKSQTVIALGGGTLEDPVCLDYVKSLGTLIYLKVPLETLWERILLKGIPSYLDVSDPQRSFYDLTKQRIPSYEKAADLTIQTEGLNEKHIADRFISLRGKNF